MEYLLAHDVGTSGCKAALVTTTGHVVATDYITYPTRFPRPLWAEQDPQDWWNAVNQSTRRVMEVSGTKPDQILSLSFSTQMVNAIPVNARGEPLMPCISWLDGRAGSEAQAVMRRLGGPGVFAALVGVALTGKDLLPKYMWLKRSEPDIYRKASAVVDCSSYLLQRSTGRLVYEWSTASVTGLFNLKTKVWDTTFIRFFGLDPSKFPELVKSTERIGRLTAEAAASLGLLEGTPVFGGAGDVMTAAVGSGSVCEGDGYLSLGTSGWAAITTKRRVTGKRGIVSIQSADPEKLMLVAETETVGACLKWAAKELYGADPNSSILAEIDQEVADVEPGAGGLIFSPWMYGERCPVADEAVRASFINLGANHSRQQMARAIYEGVAYNLRWILESISDLYAFKPDPLRVVGGGARGLPWLYIISDVCSRTLESIPNPQEATAVGAALLAAVGLGIYPTIEAVKPVIPVNQVIHPDPGGLPVYDRMFTAYRQVYRSLKNLYRHLNQNTE
jgi:xylulokinase